MEAMEDEVVYIKVFDGEEGDVVFEGKVSTDVEPHELVKLGCFRDRGWNVIFNKGTSEEVESFKGLQNNVELIAGGGDNKRFSGALYVGADDGVLRMSMNVPSFECVTMTVLILSQEEGDKVFKCETLEELEIISCKLRQIPTEIGKMKKLKKLRLEGLRDLNSIPEEIGELSNLEELRIVWCGIESLPKRLKELKMLKSISLAGLSNVQLNAEDLVVFSKLKHLRIINCSEVFAPSFTQSFWEMIKSTTDLRVLELDWKKHNRAMVVAALEENGSIVDEGWGSESYAHFFKRNKENHERALQCVVHMLTIRRFRNSYNHVPKEMFYLLGQSLWDTKCDVSAWLKFDK